MRNSLHLDAFCQFWEMNFNSPIPPLPSRPEQLTVTQVEQLRMFDGGKLYRNLFRITPESGELPAGVERDITNGRIDIGKKDLYRQYGYEDMAQQFEAAAIKYEQDKMNKEIAEMEKRNAEREKINEAKSKMSYGERVMSELLTQAQIINNQMKYHGHVGT